MIRIINGPVERIVKKDDLRKWMQLGFKLTNPLSDLPDPDTTYDPDPEPESEKVEIKSADIPKNLDRMKVSDLRKLAKEVGVQGYQNMDKATLIAVIQAH